MAIPLRAFYARLQIRRGSRIALVAVARKFAILAWHLLTHDADYRWASAHLTAQKTRAIAVKLGSSDVPSVPRRTVQEGQVLIQAEEAYRTMVLARHREEADAAASHRERSKGPKPEARRSLHPDAPIFSTRVGRATPKPTPAPGTA